LTSRTGITLRSACSKISMPGRPVRASISSSAPYTIFSARLFFPRIITRLMKRWSSTFP